VRRVPFLMAERSATCLPLAEQARLGCSATEPVAEQRVPRLLGDRSRTENRSLPSLTAIETRRYSNRMFGSLGITELIRILVCVLIVFGAGKLPKIGEGMGKALKGFKKEIREADALEPSPEQA